MPFDPAMATSANPRPWGALLPESERLGEIALRLGATLVVGIVLRQLLFLLIGRLEHWIRRAGRDSEHATKRATTIGAMTRSLATVLVAGGVLIHALVILGWDVRPLLAGAGLLGVALGFGAQTLVRDVIAGIFIIVEDQFGVGDLIEVNGRIATVEELTPRATTMRDFNGFQVFVPNGEMKMVVNRSRGWNRLAVDVPVASGPQVERALQVCERVAAAMNAEPAWRDRLLDRVEVWGVEALGPTEVTLRMVVRARPGPDAPETARELRRRVQQAQAQAGIATTLPREMPLPQPAGPGPERPAATLTT
jgi:small conductance mechanosensitive channel